jgi:hypothetical protein
VAAGFASELGAALCSSLVFSFLLQPVSSPSRQSKNIAAQIFLFIMSPFRQVYVSHQNFDKRMSRPRSQTHTPSSHL